MAVLRADGGVPGPCGTDAFDADDDNDDYSATLLEAKNNDRAVLPCCYVGNTERIPREHNLLDVIPLDKITRRTK